MCVATHMTANCYKYVAPIASPTVLHNMQIPGQYALAKCIMSASGVSYNMRQYRAYVSRGLCE